MHVGQPPLDLLWVLRRRASVCRLVSMADLFAKVSGCDRINFYACHGCRGSWKTSKGDVVDRPKKAVFVLRYGARHGVGGMSGALVLGIDLCGV